MSLTQMESLGADRLIEVINKGKPAVDCFAELLPEMLTPNFEYFSGAVSRGVQLLQTAKTNGVTVKAKDPLMQRVLDMGGAEMSIALNKAANGRDLMRLVDMLRIIGGAIDMIAKKDSRLLNAAPQRTAASEGQPLKIEIVSQPARVTTTKIERNPAGEITSSFQLEEDTLK